MQFKQKLVYITGLALVLGFLGQAEAVPVFNPANGHYYELIPSATDWFSAKAAAESLTFMGLPGHLATITSQEENDFITNNIGISGAYWLGGFQPAGSPEPDGGWQWVTDEPFDYANWRPNEPNNNGNEDGIRIRFPPREPGTWNDLTRSFVLGYIVEYESSLIEIEIEIDIKPGSNPNAINCKNPKGVISVAILTTPIFDATTVNHTTVRFGKTGTEATETHTNKKNGEPKRHEEDVDGDGDVDVVFHLRFGDTEIECSDTEAMLTGETFDGQSITGTDTIKNVGRRVHAAPALNAREKLTTTWGRMKSKY